MSSTISLSWIYILIKNENKIIFYFSVLQFFLSDSVRLIVSHSLLISGGFSRKLMLPLFLTPISYRIMLIWTKLTVEVWSTLFDKQN